MGAKPEQSAMDSARCESGADGAAVSAPRPVLVSARSRDRTRPFYPSTRAASPPQASFIKPLLAAAAQQRRESCVGAGRNRAHARPSQSDSRHRSRLGPLHLHPVACSSKSSSQAGILHCTIHCTNEPLDGSCIHCTRRPKTSRFARNSTRETHPWAPMRQRGF